MEGHAKRILIVDDDRILRRASALALERAGYAVLAAAGGREGLVLARTLPDLIVLDLIMPRPTGLEVFRALKADEATRRIPVLVVSNSSLQRIVEEVESFGDEYIVKANLSLRELGARVEKRLARQTVAPPAAGPSAPEPPASASSGPLPSDAPVESDDIPAIDELPEDDSVIRCAGCGRSVATGSTFCSKCGRKLAAPSAWSASFRRIR